MNKSIQNDKADNSHRLLFYFVFINLKN